MEQIAQGVDVVDEKGRVDREVTFVAELGEVGDADNVLAGRVRAGSGKDAGGDVIADSLRGDA